MDCLSGLRKCFAACSGRDGSSAKARTLHVPSSSLGLAAHEDCEVPSATWIESDSEPAPPPSPVHDAPEDQGAIIFPSQDDFPDIAGSSFEIVAHEDCDVPSATWIESDCEPGSPPSPGP